MKKTKRLPDTEFEIMKVVWANEPPITTNIIMEQLGNNKNWKVPTAISLLLRLVERGFLKTEKFAKERLFYPLIEKEDYLQCETGNFLKLYHNNSLISLLNSLYNGKKLNERDIGALLEWAKEREQ
ncbi:MAG: BlaI/MecI/CopY family transcriptional regulator [Clostridiales bacterium]|nr:BlaI/MecI/CopY family transcriptional regulator [Clostridiales bacterium]